MRRSDLDAAGLKRKTKRKKKKASPGARSLAFTFSANLRMRPHLLRFVWARRSVMVSDKFERIGTAFGRIDLTNLRPEFRKIYSGLL